MCVCSNTKKMWHFFFLFFCFKTWRIWKKYSRNRIPTCWKDDGGEEEAMNGIYSSFLFFLHIFTRRDKYHTHTLSKIHLVVGKLALMAKMLKGWENILGKRSSCDVKRGFIVRGFCYLKRERNTRMLFSCLLDKQEAYLNLRVLNIPEI